MSGLLELDHYHTYIKGAMYRIACPALLPSPTRPHSGYRAVLLRYLPPLPARITRTSQPLGATTKIASYPRVVDDNERTPFCAMLQLCFSRPASYPHGSTPTREHRLCCAMLQLRFPPPPTRKGRRRRVSTAFVVRCSSCASLRLLPARVDDDVGTEPSSSELKIIRLPTVNPRQSPLLPMGQPIFCEQKCPY